MSLVLIISRECISPGESPLLIPIILYYCREEHFQSQRAIHRMQKAITLLTKTLLLFKVQLIRRFTSKAASSENCYIHMYTYVSKVIRKYFQNMHRSSLT